MFILFVVIFAFDSLSMLSSLYMSLPFDLFCTISSSASIKEGYIEFGVV